MTIRGKFCIGAISAWITTCLVGILPPYKNYDPCMKSYRHLGEKSMTRNNIQLSYKPIAPTTAS